MYSTTAKTASKISVDKCSADSISSISWHPNSHIFCTTSWDGEINGYLVDPNTNSCTHKLQSKSQSALLSSTFTTDGSKLIVTGTDNSVSFLDLASSQLTKFGSHQAPVSRVRAVPAVQQYVTGGWDHTLNYWDLRSQNPTQSVKLPERIYCMDVADEILLVGCAGRQFVAYDVRNPQTPALHRPATLQYQIRDTAVCPDKSFFVETGVEGRSSLNYFKLPSQQQTDPKDYSFKCSRPANSDREMYATNAVTFVRSNVPGSMGTFITGGGDGSVVFWNGRSRQKLHTVPSATSTGYMSYSSTPVPVTALGVSFDSKMLAYAAGNDWSKGPLTGTTTQMKTALYLYPIKDNFVASSRA
ncbi:hypothetical protein RCL1_002254 [Eukaryota sp. TZLM3-RCL]